ncbi:fumarylacetoacetate hydrolase domain-containing protein 2-like [Acanthaster planci]|uniref:Fumarylacetoacetate hydrolase domain-containing protein 2-like n=1 Tax=Acanthaster planci TaxID=133434 RepID=A0A8B8A0F1_ACAPL|nr:fumarylacetoacetate hydrolase domain-containing protein 2-like [Acanthaster planci]
MNRLPKCIIFALHLSAKRIEKFGAISTLLRAQTSCQNKRYFTTSKQYSMRLVQFQYAGRAGVGVELGQGGDIVDLCAGDPNIPSNMKNFVKEGQIMLDAAKQVVLSGKHVLKRTEVNLRAPINDCDKVLCVGMNYREHCIEQKVPIPTEPIFFSKFASSIVASGDDIIYPDVTDELDWEVELVIVIGKNGKNIKESNAMDHVIGYTVAHDVSARDWQLKKNGRQWLLGKTMDTFCPLGPAIVTKDEISDPHNLGIRCRVNGDIRQDSNTNELVFNTMQLIAFISRLLTLQAGDLILTGTPSGVGVFRKPKPIYLQRGDVVECEIDEIGTISNKIV